MDSDILESAGSCSLKIFAYIKSVAMLQAISNITLTIFLRNIIFIYTYIYITIYIYVREFMGGLLFLLYIHIAS